MGIPALNSELHWGSPWCSDGKHGSAWVWREEALDRVSLSVVICLPDKQRVAEWLAFSKTRGQILHAHESYTGACLTPGRAGDTAPIGDPHTLCLVSLLMQAARSGCRSHLPVQLIFKEKIRNPVGNKSL